MENENSQVKLILVDKNFKEYLVYETYELLAASKTVTLNNDCEETAVLNGVHMYSLRLEITDAQVEIESLAFSTKAEPGVNFEKVKKEKKQAQNDDKIEKLNKNLKAKGLNWVAGITEVAEMSFEEKKALFGQSTFPAGFEYYVGGVISTSIAALKSVSESMMVGEWDWRNRHGKNWITPVTNQGSCGSCWSFASTGATEAMVNVFFNQQINLDLSEQDVLSCSGAGSCSGGYPSIALDYITNTGVVDEGTFPYASADLPCENKGTNPVDLIQINGRTDFGSIEYPKTEDDLKRMLIEKGPVSGGLFDWSHAMVLVGYKVVEEGDVFYYRDLTLSRYTKTVLAGDPLIGKTVWIFKNSWGPYFGDAGYIYVETPISNFGWTHAINTPIKSVVKQYDVICEDADGDGYFWWGLGEKPATCTGPDQPDGDDSDPTLGPLDEFGNCTILSNILPPVANFTSSATSITEGESVTFSAGSENEPTKWNWYFEGAEPAQSTAQNPSVVYSTPGNYSVTLTVENEAGSDTKTVENYIQVEDFTVEYCTTSGEISDTWIAGVQLNETSNNSGAAGYEDFSSVVFEINSANECNINLVPGYLKRKIPQYWSVWIDLNNNGSFNDAGELVFSAAKVRGTASGTFNLPYGISTTSKMRVAMSTSTPASCGSIGSGEVEDYTVNIQFIENIEINGLNEYCVPVAINSDFDYIENISIGAVLNNTSAGDSYSFNENPIVLVPGDTYTVSLLPHVAKNRNFWKIWIDLNGDADFDDAGETILAEDNKRGIVYSQISIPADASGTTRMRVAMKNGKTPEPCEDAYNGEVEDFLISFESPAAFKSGFIQQPGVGRTERFDFYPNPVIEKLKIKISEPAQNDEYQIFNMQGQLVISNSINNQETEIDCMNFTPGIYMLLVKNNDNVYKEKFVKK